MVPDTEVLTRAGIPSIHTLLQTAQARWAGHGTRMPADRLPKQLLYGELCYEKRSVGWQKKRFKDTLKKTLKIFNIDVTNWQILCPGSTTVAQYDSYRSKNIRNTQDRGGSEKARFSQSETTLPAAPQPARHTHAPSVEERNRPELDSLATSAPTGSTKQDIIIIIEEVMVIIGNDRRTTFTTQATGGCEVYRCRQHDNISMELVEECVKRRLKCYYRPTASLQLNNKRNTKYNITVT